jgi:hypothetical protein
VKSAGNGIILIVLESRMLRVARTGDASFWWICIGRRLGVAAEIRRLVGKLIWDDRVNGRCFLDRYL